MTTITILCMLAAVMLSGCKESSMDVPAPILLSSLRFGVGSSATSSRTVGSGLSSNFEDGDKIGCIIAYRESGGYKFAATTRWTYNADNSILILREIHNPQNDSFSDVSTTASVIHRHPDYDSETGYVELAESGKEYCFFFFYPCIDNSDVDEAFKDLVNNHKDPYKISIPFSGFALELNPNWDSYWTAETRKLVSVVGLADKEGKMDYSDNHPHFCWTAYPCYASIAQGSAKQLDNSNFMYARYVMDQRNPSKPVTPEDESTHYTVDLQFRKKMAAIDLVIEDSEIDRTDGSIYYRNIPEENEVDYYNGTYSNFFIIGKRINLSTGEFSDYPDYRQEWQLKNAGFQEYEYAAAIASHVSDAYEDNGKNAKYNRVRPCPMGNGVYRMLLPPQTSFKCRLCFRKNGEEHFIDLYEKIPVLKENTLYTIRLRKGGWDIRIRDWEKGSGMLLEENT